MLESSKKVSNVFYKYLISSQGDILIKYLHRWQEDKNIIPPNFEEYQKLFKKIYSITNITKLRDFQYKLLLCKIFTNQILFTWKVTETDLCTFCNKESESEVHLFVTCKEVKILWEYLTDWLSKQKIIITLSTEQIIFNNIELSKNVVNYLILLTKFFIYRNRCQKKTPTTRELEYDIKMYYQIEKYNAKVTNNYDKHKKKWSSITVFKNQETELHT